MSSGTPWKEESELQCVECTKNQLPLLRGIAAVVAAPIIASLTVPVALGAIGFGVGGIAAGSAAAGIQAGIGNAVAGSVFATLQSAGMGGSAVALVQGVAGATAALAAGAATIPGMIERRVKGECEPRSE